MKNLILIALMMSTVTAFAQIRELPGRPGRGGGIIRPNRPTLPPPRYEGPDDDFRTAYGSDLQIGRTVYTRYGQTGTVVAIFPNGDIMVNINGIQQTKNRSDLAVEGCRRMMGKRLCSRDTVYTAYGQTGSVRGFFPSNELMIDISGILQAKDRENLAVPGCANDFCTGDAVVTRYGQNGTIRGVFVNGDVMVDISGILQRKSTSDLANQTEQPYPRPGDYDAVRIGQKVWTRYGQEGTVTAIFASGEIMVNMNGIQQTKNRSDLAVEGCATRDLCSGDRVINRYGQTGIVRAIFQNRTEVLVDMNGILQVRNVSDLARTN